MNRLITSEEAHEIATEIGRECERKMEYQRERDAEEMNRYLNDPCECRWCIIGRFLRFHE